MSGGHQQGPGPSPSGFNQGPMRPPPGFPSLLQQSAPVAYHGNPANNLQPRTRSFSMPTGPGAHEYSQGYHHSAIPSMPSLQLQNQSHFQMRPEYQSIANSIMPQLQFPYTQHPDMFQAEQYKMSSDSQSQFTQPHGYMVQSNQASMTQAQQDHMVQSNQFSMTRAQHDHMVQSNQFSMTQAQQGQMVQLSHPPVTQGQQGQMVQPSQPPMTQGQQGQMVQPSHTPMTQGQQGQMVQPSHTPMTQGQQGQMVQPSQPPMTQGQQGQMVQPSHPPMTEGQHGHMVQPNQQQRVQHPQNNMTPDQMMDLATQLSHFPAEQRPSQQSVQQVSHPKSFSPSQQSSNYQSYQPNHHQPHYDTNKPPQVQMQSVSHQPNHQPGFYTNQPVLQTHQQSFNPEPNKTSYEPLDITSSPNPQSFDQAPIGKNLKVGQDVNPDGSESQKSQVNVAVDDLINGLSAMSLKDGNTSFSKTSVSATASFKEESKDSTLDASLMDMAQSSNPAKAGVTSTILVGNLSPRAQEEDLRNYLEGWIDEDVDIVRYTRDHTQAVVTFKQDIDLQKGKQLSKLLDGKKPTISSLGTTNQLSVWGVQIGSVDKEITTYFQSPSSGNTDRTMITGKSEMDGVIVLTFHDPRAVKNILAKDAHHFDEKCLFVEEFFQDVGEPVWNEGNIKTKECPLEKLATRLLLVTNFGEWNIFKKLNVKVTINEKENVIHFVGPSLFVKFSLEELLRYSKVIHRHNTLLELSRNKVKLLDNEVTGEYILKKMTQKEIQGAWLCSTKNAKVRLVSTTDDGLKDTEEIVKSSLVETEIEAEEISEEQCAEIQHQVETRNPDTYFILHNQGNAILLVATDADVELLKNDIQVLVEKMLKTKKELHQERTLREEEEIIKTILTLTPLRTRYIKLRMQDDVNEIQKQYSLRVLAEEEGFQITGERYNCKAAIDNLKRLADKLKVKEDKWEGSYMTELYKNDLIPFITQYLEQREDCAAEVSVKHSKTIRALDDFSVHLLVGDFPLDSDAVMVAVDENFVPLGSFAQVVYEKGGSQVREECARYQSKKGCLEVGKVVMTIAGTLSNVQKILHASFPESFESMEQEEELVYNAVMTSLVCAEEEKLESVAISILENEESISFATRGVVKGLAYQLQNRVTKHVKNVFLLCEDRMTFEAFSKNSSIFLNFQEEEEENGLPSTSNDQTIDVEVIKGDLSKQKMDIIVNSVDKSLNLSRGNISKCLLAAGGDVLQADCDKRYPGGIQIGEFAETGGGNLSCKRVYHCCLPFYSKEDTKYLQDFKKLIQEVLDLASDSGLRSIAFPSLGTGKRGYSVHDVAKYMFECIRLHKKTHPHTSVRLIKFVIYEMDEEIYKVYKQYESKYKKKALPSSPGASERLEPPPKSYAAAAKGEASINTWLSPEHQQHQKQQAEHSSGSIKIRLVIGAIADQQVDVLVNSVDTWLDLKHGAVSASILKTGGSVIQNEVRSRYGHKGVQCGQFVESGGGNLSCKKIYHSCLPRWGMNGDGNIIMLTSLIIKCLHQAGKDGHRSIAFPAFGTGVLGYPKDQVAEAMYNAVTHFSINYPYRFADVCFVVYEKDADTISAFNRRHAVYERLTHSSTSPVYKGQEWKMNNLKIVAKQGDILTEACETMIVPVSRSLSLRDCTVSGNLLTTERGVKLQDNCYEIRQSFDKRGWVMLDSNDTCAAKMLFLINKEDIRSGQQLVLLKALKIIDDRGFASLALPILATGRDAKYAAALAKDLFSALKTFAPAKNLQQVTVVVYQPEQLEVFKQVFSDAYYIPKRRAPSPPKHQQVVYKAREPSGPEKVVSQAPMNKELQITSKTRVLYRVTSPWTESLGRAMETLRYLNTTNKEFLQKITEIRLKSIGRSEQREFTQLQTDSVQVSLKRQEMEILVTGESLEALKVLRSVATKMSKLPKNKKKAAPKSPTAAKTDQLSPTYKDTATASLTPEGTGSTNKDKVLSSTKTGNDASPEEGAECLEQKIMTQSMSLDTGKTVKYVDHTQCHREEEKENSGEKNNYGLNDATAVGGSKASSAVINKELAAALAEEVIKHNEGKYPDDDTWVNLELDEIHDSNSAEMNISSPKMDTIIEMDSVLDQMNSNSTHKDSSSAEMKTNPSPVNTDQYKMDTTPNPAESTDTAEQDDTETDTKIEWFCVNDTESGRELQSYEPMNEKIESMYIRGEGSVLLPGEDEEYVIDFSTMEEYVKGSEEDKVSVVRREILPATESDVPLPAHLKNLSSDSKLVLVDRTSQEFDTIRSRFLRASRDAKVTVVKIEKMLNVSVYKNYQRKKNQILGSGALTPGDHVERSLWHGPLVNTDSIVNLSSFGFNRSYCNSAGERQCGDGVYFYPFADTILARSKMDASGHHHVCLAKVLTGRLEEADSSTLSVGRMRRLPKGCHSVVDHKSMPTKFVIFFDNQALPEYLVTFSVDQDEQ